MQQAFFYTPPGATPLYPGYNWLYLSLDVLTRTTRPSPVHLLQF